MVLVIPVRNTLNAEELSQTERGNSISAHLLRNPSFEGQYGSYVPPGGHPDCPYGVCMTAQMASDWTPWWLSHNPEDDNWIIRMPEYKPAAPFENRIKSGENAQQYFTFYSTHRAGIFQRVKVDAGCMYQFTIWGHSWSSIDDNPETSDSGFPLNQKVGIDPTGGTDWTSAEIEWAEARYQPNEFGLFSVAAVAFEEHITVFTYSEPEWAAKHNDVYWDDANLSKQGSVCDMTMSVSPDSEIGFRTKLSDPKEMSTTIHINLPDNPGISWQAELKPGGTLTAELSASSGSPTEDLVVTVDSNGMFLGSYSTELTITSVPRLVGSPVTIPIGLVITDQMRVSSKSGIASLVLESEPKEISTTVHIDLPDHPGISWHAELEPGGTLIPELSASNGSPAEDLVITVDSNGKALGIYTAELTISSDPRLIGSPVTIPITLVVTDQIHYTYFPVINNN
jgi:hypothetical protein